MKTSTLTALALATAMSLVLAAPAMADVTIQPVMAKAAPAKVKDKLPAATIAPAEKEVDYQCRTKSPGIFDSVHEYTCAYQAFLQNSITLGDAKKMEEFIKLWDPKLWVNTPLLKMDGVSEDDRKVNTFALIRRMRDFTHERFDYVNSPEQAKGIEKEIIHPTLPGGIGAILRVDNMSDILKALDAEAPKDSKDPAVLKAWQEKYNGSFVIGPEHHLVVDVPVQGSPAWGSLKAGDIIVQVDSTKTDGLTLDHIVTDLIRGTQGTEVVLHVLRNVHGVMMPLDFYFVRSQVQEHAVFSRDVDGIRHITIANFENDYVVDDFYKAVMEAKELGMKGIDVDLRNDPGGRLDYVMAMLELVVPRGLILSSHNRDTGAATSSQTDYVLEDGYGITAEKTIGEGDSTKQLDPQPRVPYTSAYAAAMQHNPQFVMEHPLQAIVGLDMPIVVTQNGNSYSASEIFAGAIQATHRGIIIGEPSAGKGAIMGDIPLPEGGSLAVTFGQFYPGGIDTKLKGILPDRPVKPSEDFGKTDPQRDAASAAIEAEYARLQAIKTLEAERIKVNSARFEKEMGERDANDALPPKDQHESN